ncbi:hypothetical protein AYO43_03145 [Nitrospira sp. SCGC AG-212-E16]|nr:hypothetical protein AYO43_03145 [Nitrospira sp. SCGC AG-212-E16]
MCIEEAGLVLARGLALCFLAKITTSIDEIGSPFPANQRGNNTPLYPLMTRHPYVLVNNRAEGNAPLTVEALSQMLCT